jgi:hypothetical protein
VLVQTCDDKLLSSGPLAGSCEFCAGLIRLCGSLDFFSPDVEVRRLLIDRLHRYADDHAHARAIIDRWLEDSPVAPKVSDLLRYAVKTRAEAARETLPNGCAVCSGEPWVIGPDGAVRCSCARGQALARMSQGGRAA